MGILQKLTVEFWIASNIRSRTTSNNPCGGANAHIFVRRLLARFIRSSLSCTIRATNEVDILSMRVELTFAKSEELRHERNNDIEERHSRYVCVPNQLLMVTVVFGTYRSAKEATTCKACSRPCRLSQWTHQRPYSDANLSYVDWSTFTPGNRSCLQIGNAFASSCTRAASGAFRIPIKSSEGGAVRHWRTNASAVGIVGRGEDWAEKRVRIQFTLTSSLSTFILTAISSISEMFVRIWKYWSTIWDILKIYQNYLVMVTSNFLPVSLQYIIDPRKEPPFQLIADSINEWRDFQRLEKRIRVEIRLHEFIEKVIKKRLVSSRILMSSDILHRESAWKTLPSIVQTSRKVVQTWRLSVRTLLPSIRGSKDVIQSQSRSWATKLQCFEPPIIPAINSAADLCLFMSIISSWSSIIGFKIGKSSSSSTWTIAHGVRP